MKTYRSTIIAIALFLSAVSSLAQDVTITVTPIQKILPPQVLLYVSNPGKYFNISITNNTQNTQNIYMGLQLEQRFPSSGLAVSTPANRIPRQPISIGPNSTRQLSLVEVKTLFNHIPSNEISTTPGLFDDYLNGSFGLLPEGDYVAHLTAYRWDPALANPVVVSNPNSGTCYFTVCYKAQAPSFITPMVTGTELLAVASVDESNAQFTWTESMINCNPAASQFRYDFVVKALLPNQQPDDAITYNPVVYHSDGLMVPMCIIPPAVIRSLNKSMVYVAQVTAREVGKNPLNYIMLENEGKSTYRLFRFKSSLITTRTINKPGGVHPTVPYSGGVNTNTNSGDVNTTANVDIAAVSGMLSGGGGPTTRSITPGAVGGVGNTFTGGDDEDDDENKKKDYGMSLDYGVQEEVDEEATYTFRNPELVEPLFFEGSARKTFVEDDIKTSWKKAWFLGGAGERPDTVKFDYHVALYKGECGQEFEDIFKEKPVYTFDTKETEHTIAWKDIKEKVNVNDYLVLHVVPSTTTESVTFVNDSVNVKDFALSQLLSKKYFQCSDMVEITNTTPTTLSANDLRGKVVGLGQYQLTIDEITKVPGKNAFKGKGHVEWNPMGYTVMVAVMFDELYINTDNIVYQGDAVSYPDEKHEATDAEVVDKIFSDTGIDQIIADTGIPYADMITGNGVSALKDIAKTYDISKYYKWVKNGENLYKNFLHGNISDLHLPLKLPTDVNKTMVDIQIASMRFSPTHSTMNVIGEVVLPKSNYTRNEILVFGAPRICMSPDRVLPEGGAISLLSDFNITDPSTKFEMDFKAPQDVVNPKDGCYISWKAGELELVLIDIDMKIPKLRKVDSSGNATKERPILNIKESIASWDDLVVTATMDDFEVDGVSGWTFKPGSIVFDYSCWREGGTMTLPDNYNYDSFDYSKNELKANPGLWQGLYINNVGILFPKTLKFGDAKNTEGGRLKISAENIIYDKSGLTLSLKTGSLLDAKTSKLGGWAFSIDNLQMNVLQSKFKNTFFEGQFDVPLLDGNIGYKCDITSQGLNEENQTQGYDYTFTTQQINGLELDFFLGSANFEKNQTYFELTAGDGKDTRVELCAGGTVTITGTKEIDSRLPFGLKMPRIKFAKLRVGNFSLAESKLYKSITTSNSWTLLDINKAAGFKEEYSFTGSSSNNNSTVYFGPGAWSLASLQKNIGPFGFTLKKYGLKNNGEKLGLNLEGSINFMDDLISVGTDITIWGKVNLQNFSASYSNTDFNKAQFDMSWAGVELNGSLEAKNETKGNATVGGYSGKLHFKLPGGIVEIDGTGGYYSYSGSSAVTTTENSQNYKYGYFIAKVAGTGLHIPPVVINEVKGGFYFNCTAAKDQNGDPTPRKGLIGGVFGLGLAVEGGENLLNGKFDMTVVYDTKYKCLSTFLMNGTLNALSTGGDDGIISAKTTIAYQCLKDNSGPGGAMRTKDQYFSLDLSCDVKITPANLANAITTTMDQYTGMMAELEGNISAVTGLYKDSSSQWKSTTSAGLDDTMGTDSENNTFKDGEKAPENSEHGSGEHQKSKEVSASAGGHIALNFKVTKYENYTAYSKPKWHVYLGEPGDGTEASEEEKRCGIKIIDLKAKVVTVKIGANAYLCVGNELPNNGVLPPIPADIRNFLNGGSAGAGVEQADAATVNRSREAAMEKFLKKASISGGVMFGYKAYGYIDVDLGLLYAYLGAVAGIDVSLVKINSFCNGKQMGIKGWYATGQAYAMLEAKMGIRIRLGFYNNDFDILHAQIGAMLKAGLPNPFWMVGQARVKLKLLGGLIKINRAFKFECGSVCLPYLGSPLDNFDLFTNCSVGGESRQEGWEDAEPITPSTQIVVETSTEMATRLNLYDENFAQQLAFDRGGDNDDYKEYSNRSYTFNFATRYSKRESGKSIGKEPVYTWKEVPGIGLTEFESPNKEGGKYQNDSINYGRDYIAVVSDGNRHRILLSNSVLRPNRYYKLWLYGNAKEIKDGLERDPYSMDTLNGTYGNYPWSTMKVYYFRTGNFNAFNSSPSIGIQDDVALAFPSPDGHMVLDTLNATPSVYSAYKVDISRPNIAFLRDVSSKFENNRLKWALYDETAQKYVSEDVSNYKSSYAYDNLNWLPDKKLIEESNLDPTHTYVIKLEYVRPKTAAEKQAEADAKAAEEAAKAAEEAANASQSSGGSQSGGFKHVEGSGSGTHYFVHGGVVYEEGSVHQAAVLQQIQKKERLFDAVKQAGTTSSFVNEAILTPMEKSRTSGSSTAKRASTSSSTATKASSSSSSSSGTATPVRYRRVTTKYVPLVIQTPLRGNTNTRMVGNINDVGKVGNVGSNVKMQQPSAQPVVNKEQAAKNFAVSVGNILTPQKSASSVGQIQNVDKKNSSLVVANKVVNESEAKRVSSSNMARPSADNISFNNPFTNKEVTDIKEMADRNNRDMVFTNKPSMTTIPKTKDEIIAQFFPNGRPSKGRLGKMTVDEIIDYIESKNVDRVRPDIVEEVKAEHNVKDDPYFASHQSGSGGGGSSSSSSSSSQPVWSWPEPTDQENKHVLLFGVRVKPSAVLNPVTEQVIQEPMLSYSYPFMGDQEMGVAHKYSMNDSPNDYDLAFDQNEALVSVEGESGKKSLRLIDPYYYYNYLGGYANVSGWEAKRYKYDDYPNLSTQGLIFTSKYHTVTPTLSEDPKHSYNLAQAARTYRNYTNTEDQMNQTWNIGSAAARIGGIPYGPIPSKSNFQNYPWITDEGFSWIKPVAYTSFAPYYAKNTVLTRDIFEPYTQLASFVDAVHRAARYFYDFFEDERGWFNDIYRGCYINSYSYFITSQGEWQSHLFQSSEKSRMYTEIRDTLDKFNIYERTAHPSYYSAEVQRFINDFCWGAYSSEDVMDGFTDFKEFLDDIYETRTYNSQTHNWQFSISKKDKSKCLEWINKYKASGTADDIYNKIAFLVCAFDDFYNPFQGVYTAVYNYHNPVWDELWASYLRGKSSMFDDSYMFQMPYQQIPLMYASRFKGSNSDSKRTKLEEVLVGMGGSHPRRNRDEADKIWYRIEGTKGANYSDYERFDAGNTKYVKGVIIERHRANTFSFQKGAYEVYRYPGVDKFPESDKRMAIDLNK